MQAHLSLPASVSAARLPWLLLGVGALAAAGLLLHAEQAEADHDPDATVHVCARDGSGLRLTDDCRGNETEFVLATEDGLEAAENRIATLESDLATAENRITTLESDLAGAESRIAELEATLEGVARTTDADGNDTLQFAGMNVQVVNGQGATATANGLGNLIVGYNEDFTCIPEQGRDCPASSDNAEDARTGSHMLVAGIDHTYTTYGGLLAGADNTTSGNWASVSGGLRNTASGDWAWVSGGRANTASGLLASISGGRDNIASGGAASVSGGRDNEANGSEASVSGGLFNQASGHFASVSGGNENIASGEGASVSGGEANAAEGALSSILGDLAFTVDTDWGCHPSC